MNIMNLNEGRPVYFSYARNSKKKPEWEHISDCMSPLLGYFKSRNIEFRLDKRDIGTGDKISAFENEIGWNSEVVVIVFSDKYFRSMHCMYEFVQIKAALKMYPEKRLMCIKSGDFDLADFNYIRDLEHYWNNQKIEYEDIFHRIREHSETEKAAYQNGFYLDDIRKLYSFFSAINYTNAKTIDFDKFTEDIIKYYVNTPTKPKLTPKPADAVNFNGSKLLESTQPKKGTNPAPKTEKPKIENGDNNHPNDNSKKRTAVIIGLLVTILGISVLTYAKFGKEPETIVIPSNDTTDTVNDSVLSEENDQDYLGADSDSTENVDVPEMTIDVDDYNFKMIFVPGGTFQMGATPEQQSNTSDEYPIHSVKLNNFYIGQTEVTQGLWKSIMGNNPSNFKKGDDYPVEKVSWADCIEFITKLNEKTGKEFRLPTEAEWEYAARGGGNKSLGCKFSGNNNIDEVAWYKKNSNKHILLLRKQKTNLVFMI